MEGSERGRFVTGLLAVWLQWNLIAPSKRQNIRSIIKAIVTKTQMNRLGLNLHLSRILVKKVSQVRSLLLQKTRIACKYICIRKKCLHEDAYVYIDRERTTVTKNKVQGLIASNLILVCSLCILNLCFCDGLNAYG